MKKKKISSNMKVISAGILMYRFKNSSKYAFIENQKKSKILQVFLVHPGGPFYKRKDNGYWTIPKGEIQKNEIVEKTAIREFEEETGIKIKFLEALIDIGYIFQKSGKQLFVWAYENDFDGQIKSNMVNHPEFGQFPEVDKGEYFTVEEAKVKIMPAQFPLIERLMKEIDN